jgi:ketosteroid isomerase-like protein
MVAGVESARHWKGRQQIEAEHTSRLAQFRESTWTSKAVTVQLLKPDVALVHVDWILKGDKDPDGTPRQPAVVSSRGSSSSRAVNG